LKIQRGYIRNTAYAEYENEVIPVITGATGTILKSFRIISEKYKWKARHHGITENSHTGRCIHAYLEKY